MAQAIVIKWLSYFFLEILSLVVAAVCFPMDHSQSKESSAPHMDISLPVSPLAPGSATQHQQQQQQRHHPQRHLQEDDYWWRQLLDLSQQAWDSYWKVYEQQPTQTIFSTSILVLLMVILAASGLLHMLILLGLGCAAGYSLATPDITLLRPSHLLEKLRSRRSSLLHTLSGSPHSTPSSPGNPVETSFSGGPSSPSSGRVHLSTHHEVTISISPAINQYLDSILSLFVRDFITYWYQGLNGSGNDDFERQVRYTLNVVVMNFVEYGRSISNGSKNLELSSLITYGFANALIVHMVCLIMRMMSRGNLGSESIGSWKRRNSL